jgi:hypothetical protein
MEEIKIIKIIYIHDYPIIDNTGIKLEKVLKNHFGASLEIIYPDLYSNAKFLNFEDIDDMIDMIYDYTDNYKPDIIIGSGLGGFFAINTSDQFFKISINPCLRPSKFLNLDDKDLIYFEENRMMNPSYEQGFDLNYIVLSNNDEYYKNFGFDKIFKKEYSNRNIYDINSKHLINEEIIETTIIPIINKSFIDREKLNERIRQDNLMIKLNENKNDLGLGLDSEANIVDLFKKVYLIYQNKNNERCSKF